MPRGRACAVVFAFALGGCALAPPAPRVPGWLDPAAKDAPLDDDERAIRAEADKALADLETRDAIVADPKATVYLDGVLARLLPAPLPANAPKPALRIKRSADAQASSFDGGLIVMSTSALAVVENEAQLAALLGHELGHFLARDGVVERRYARLTTSTVDRMELARTHELAADDAALGFMRRAGYDPREMVRLLTLIEPDDRAKRGPVFAWESHPYVRDRLKAARRKIGDAVAADAVVGRDAYEDAMADVFLVAAQTELDTRRLERAKATIDRCLRVRPASGRAYFLLAEHARLTEPDGRRAATARAAYERAVELAPDDPEAVRALALLYRDDGDLGRARPLLATYLRVAPQAPDRKLIERYLAGSAAP